MHELMVLGGIVWLTTRCGSSSLSFFGISISVSVKRVRLGWIRRHGGYGTGDRCCVRSKLWSADDEGGAERIDGDEHGESEESGSRSWEL